MIKSDFGKVAVNGNSILLMAELTAIIRCMLKENIIDEDDLDEVLKLAKEPAESLEKQKNDYLKNMTTGDLQDMINKFLEAMRSGLLTEKQKEDFKKFFGEIYE